MGELLYYWYPCAGVKDDSVRTNGHVGVVYQVDGSTRQIIGDDFGEFTWIDAVAAFAGIVRTDSHTHCQECWEILTEGV